MNRYSAWLALLLVCVSVQAQSLHPFRSFLAHKVQLPEGTTDLILLVDESCANTAASEVQVQHKISGGVRFKALRAKISPTEYKKSLLTLAADPCVLGITADGTLRIASDPRLSEQLALPAISFEDAERVFYHPRIGLTRAAVIAVADTGLTLTHPDLVTRIWRGPAFEPGYDFHNDDPDPTDDNGHGTHVSGIIAAQRGNAVGIRGVMGEGSRLMALKTQDALGDGSFASVINAITWAADKGADVINLSLAGAGRNPALRDAIEYAVNRGVFVAIAAGNQGVEVSDASFISPVGYAKDMSGVMGVGAIDALTLARPGFSNFSPSLIELGAPGRAGTNGILSTYMNGGYFRAEGTSMASPHVAAAAGLAIAFARTHGLAPTPAQVEDWIGRACLREAALQTSFVEGHRLDLKRLGRVLLHETLLDSDGGFDAP